MSAQIERLRSTLAETDADVSVLTNVHNVLYASEYRSTVERWGLVEPVSAVVIPSDPSLPTTLVLPEAMLSGIAVLEDQGKRIGVDQVRVFEFTNFCEVGRAIDPHAGPSAIGEVAMAINNEKRRGESRDNILLAIRDALAALGGPAAMRVGVDDLRVGAHLQLQDGLGRISILDVYEATMIARSIKTAAELERFDAMGPAADAAMAAGLGAVQPGVQWSEVETAVVRSLTDHGGIPVDDGGVLFGGVFRDKFIPELFRTRSDAVLEPGCPVILEVLGHMPDLWMDINRTSVVGRAPTPAFQRQHEAVNEIYRMLQRQMIPGAWTNDLPAMGQQAARDAGLPAPEKLLVIAHSVGYMPFEMPAPFPAYGRPAGKGFQIKEAMVLSLDCLYFGAKEGPCHMENVFVIGKDAARSLYATPMDLPSLMALTGVWASAQRGRRQRCRRGSCAHQRTVRAGARTGCSGLYG